MNKLVLCTAWLNQRMHDERGAGLAEYALLLFVIAVAIAGTVGALGLDIGAAFQGAIDALPSTG